MIFMCLYHKGNSFLLNEANSHTFDGTVYYVHKKKKLDNWKQQMATTGQWPNVNKYATIWIEMGLQLFVLNFCIGHQFNSLNSEHLIWNSS